jgi:hypothetical protein
MRYDAFSLVAVLKALRRAAGDTAGRCPGRARVTSPARLVRARSGVFPYADSAVHLDELSAWISAPVPFALCLIGGRGGAGKTRLGVELCEQTTARAGSLSGLLPRSTDPAGLRDLADAPAPRLAVIDYAETASNSLKRCWPALPRAFTDQGPFELGEGTHDRKHQVRQRGILPGEDQLFLDELDPHTLPRELLHQGPQVVEVPGVWCPCPRPGP